MYKKLMLTLAICGVLSTQVVADKLQDACDAKGNTFIYAGGECIEYYKADGDSEGFLNIIVHGSWPDGTNTLGRYAPFADNIAMATDTITVAVSLPGYSKSSNNKLKTLIKGGKTPLATTKEYVKFMEELVIALKNKYDANTVTYVGHSAGAIMGATVSGKNPDLIQNIALVGGRYDIHEVSKEKNLISAVDVINNINKDMKMVLIYGDKDTISAPKVTIDFYNLAKRKGFSPKLIEVKGGVHVDLDMSDESVKAIAEMVDNSKKQKAKK
ncbi:MAG: alpha/beta hydrolase [Arcobacteraceae bacterium]